MLPFATHCATVERHIRDHYGIRVITRDIPDPLTGDLDGAEIHIDHAVSEEERLFLLAHLFGHTVQWNTSAQSREIGYRPYENPTEAQLLALIDYEHDACRYSLQLFHDAGIRDLDQWLCDYSACDLRYLMHFYRQGEKRPILSFWKDGSELFKPLPIPAFTPTRWVARWEGVVV
jgi:hypothetical protein